MSNPTPAQEEFAAFLDKNNRSDLDGIDPEDRNAAARGSDDEHSEDEEDRYRASQIDAAMRMPTMDAHAEIRLPPAEFDRGRSTGVKGVIADARSYETARQSKWKERVRSARRSVFGLDSSAARQNRSSEPDSDGSGPEDPDEAAFLEQWRESRRRELEQESRNPVRNRRTSPSIRLYGRFDHVDALGYLDAIEKVGRETVVVVFVYDSDVCAHPAHAYDWHSWRLTRYNRATFQQPSSLLWSPLSPLIPPSTSSRCLSKISSSTMPAYPPFSHTGTRATCSPT
jgi:hypothetical protein